MGPWLVDANDITDLKSFDEGLLHRTNAIDRYLHDTSDRFLLVATKGFGKTFLLKAKRIRHERSGMIWIPDNSLVDKLAGEPRIFSDDDVKNIINDGNYWVNIWILAIALTVLRKLNNKPTQVQCPGLQSIIDNPHFTTISDTFANLISLSRNEYFQALGDQKTRIIPMFRSCHSQVAAFIDNVDEFFNIHLGADSTRYASTGAVVKDFWYNAQCGLVEAVDQLHAINQHVKVFCSIRSEAFSKLTSNSQKALQYRGHALDLTYTDEDLLEIFSKNVRNEPPSNLVEPGNADAMAAFVGSANLAIDHLHTGEKEGIGSYILRHTLRRPRDIAAIGRKISELPIRRRSQEKIKQAINETATQIGDAYLEETRPHVQWYDRELLFRLIKTNVLSRRDLEEVSKQYDASVGHQSHIFCLLYKIGLLGYVTRPDLDDRRVQQFVPPGVLTFADDGVLPEASHYLIHSVLDGIIRPYSERYREKFNKWNIVGHSRIWRRPTDSICIIEGDIRDYSSIMDNADLAHAFPKQFEASFAEHSWGLLYAEQIKGDSFRIGDVNPLRLIAALQRILREAQQIHSGIGIRLGGDYGFVEFDEQGLTPRAGQMLRVISRIESIGIPNHLLVTRRFIDRLAETDGKQYEFMPVQPDELKLPWSHQGFNISKGGDDKDLFEHLWQLKLS